MKRRAAIAAGVLIALVAASPAAAHEELAPNAVGTGRPVFVTLKAANERQVPVTGVVLAPPAGLALGSVSREPEGWTVERGADGITWSGGSVAPGKFEEWGFELEAPDQPGAFTFRSTLRFADGRTDSHEIVLTVSQGPAPAPAAPVPTTATAPTTLAEGPATTSADAPGDDDDVTSARRQANLALGVGGVGALAAVAALVVATRRRPASAARPDGDEQEW